MMSRANIILPYYSRTYTEAPSSWAVVHGSLLTFLKIFEDPMQRQMALKFI